MPHSYIIRLRRSCGTEYSKLWLQRCFGRSRVTTISRGYNCNQIYGVKLQNTVKRQELLQMSINIVNEASRRPEPPCQVTWLRFLSAPALDQLLLVFQVLQQCVTATVLPLFIKRGRCQSWQSRNSCFWLSILRGNDLGDGRLSNWYLTGAKPRPCWLHAGFKRRCWGSRCCSSSNLWRHLVLWTPVFLGWNFGVTIILNEKIMVNSKFDKPSKSIEKWCGCNPPARVRADLVSAICTVETSRYCNHPGLLLLYGKINGSLDF